MNDRILINDTACGHALARKAGTVYNPAVDINFCRLKDGKKLGGVVFTQHTHESIAIHSASWTNRWINRDLIFLTFDYPFNQLGVKRIFGLVPEDNHVAQEFNLNVGFRTVARIEGVYPGNVACVVMRMDREDCRFLDIKPRHLRSNRAAA